MGELARRVDELESRSPPSNGGLESRLHQLIAEIERAGKSEVRAALDDELTRRAGAFLGGVEPTAAHPYRRPPSRQPVLWREGTTRLIDYGRGSGGLPVLAIPSLVNRYYVLDLLRECSFLRHLAGEGLRPLAVDWDAPGPEERGFSMSDYIAGRLDRALDAAVAAAGRPVALVGYCMGGLLALALALRRPAETACLALLATPWDFHADRPEQASRLAAMIEAMLLGPNDAPLAVDPIQMLFWSLDPLLGERKFVRFAGLDPEAAPRAASSRSKTGSTTACRSPARSPANAPATGTAPTSRPAANGGSTALRFCRKISTNPR